MTERESSLPSDAMLSFFWNDSSLTAREGQSVAAALLASGRKTLRITSRGAQPRGLFCGMGICFDCLVHIDGRPNQRACQILVTEGMRVLTQQGAGVWEVLP